MIEAKDPKSAAGACMDSVALDPELYRLGHTKARSIYTFYIFGSWTLCLVFWFQMVFPLLGHSVTSKEDETLNWICFRWCRSHVKLVETFIGDLLCKNFYRSKKQIREGMNKQGYESPLVSLWKTTLLIFPFFCFILWTILNLLHPCKMWMCIVIKSLPPK